MEGEERDGGPAFPTTQPFQGEGMSLLDYFAAKAMAVFTSGPALADLDRECEAAQLADERRADAIDRVIAKRSYRLARAMLNERARGKEAGCDRK